MINVQTRVSWAVLRLLPDGSYADVATDCTEETARKIHRRWQDLITPERKFCLAKRTVTDEIVTESIND